MERSKQSARQWSYEAWFQQVFIEEYTVFERDVAETYGRKYPQEPNDTDRVVASNLFLASRLDYHRWMDDKPLCSNGDGLEDEDDLVAVPQGL